MTINTVIARIFQASLSRKEKMTDQFTTGPWVNIGNCRIHGTPAYIGPEATLPGGEWEGVPGNSIQEVCVAFPASVYGYNLNGKLYPVRKDVQERWWARNKANIDLICAAPVMLAALRDIFGNGDGSGRNPQLMVDAARDAIAKAEGNV